MRNLRIGARLAVAFGVVLALLATLSVIALVRASAMRDDMNAVTQGIAVESGLADRMRLAATLFERTARDYSHSGRQSWAWYSREPDVESLLRQIGAVGDKLRPVMGELMVSGLRELGRHPETAKRLREALKTDSR